MTREELAQECLRIEEAGGDVLGYIAKNMPSYTPRAAWYNLQSECLKRKPHQLTEGKPEEKGGEDMGKMKDMAYAVMDAYDKVENVYEWLETHGYRNASSQWYQLKQYAMNHDLELYERMCKMKSKRRPSGSAKAKPGDNKATVKKEPETVKFGGKEYVKMVPEKMTNPPWPKEDDKKISDVTAYIEKPSPTCCQPARQGGPIKWDDNEAMNDGPEVISKIKLSIKEEPIKELKTAKDAKPIYPIGNEEMVFSVKKMDSKLGTWEYCREKDVYIFQSNWLDDQSLNVLALSIKDWLNLAAEIPKALRMLTEIIER